MWPISVCSSSPSRPEMLVVCPSRSRPQNIAALLDAWDPTEAFATLAVCLDQDDPCRFEYLEMLDPYPSDKVIVIGGKWRSFCDWVNFVAVTIGGCHAYNIIGQMSRMITILLDNALSLPNCKSAVALLY